MMVPIIEAVQTINSYGMEVVSGIILGLDTDTPNSGRHLLEFVEQSHIPMLTMNLLQALPRTPLWDRLKREQRLIEDDDSLQCNVVFHMPYDQVLAMWQECMPARADHRHQRQYKRGCGEQGKDRVKLGGNGEFRQSDHRYPATTCWQIGNKMLTAR